jgi:hypothetical protein
MEENVWTSEVKKRNQNSFLCIACSILLTVSLPCFIKCDVVLVSFLFALLASHWILVKGGRCHEWRCHAKEKKRI